jgi:MFS family permease
LAPLLNFLAGINIDIYSPSMPAIASYFNASIAMTKNTISVTVAGWAMGAVLFGTLIDSLGRKNVLVYGLLFYVIASLLAPWCDTIPQLMVVRFIQGLTVATMTVGCRAIVTDSISGYRYNVAILYTILGYGLGPIVGPFIGSLLQHYFTWQANFIALASLALLLLLILIFFVKESIPARQSLSVKGIGLRYISVIKHKGFIIGVFLIGLINTQLMLYATLGPFIVENILNKSVLVYGNSALLVSAGYLLGNLAMRLLIKTLSLKQICNIGFIILLLALLIFYLFTVFWHINLFTLVLPSLLICISAGLIMPGVMATNLRQFADRIGVAMATQACLCLLVVSLGIFIVSQVKIVDFLQVSIIFSVLAFIEITVFFAIYRKLIH